MVEYYQRRWQEAVYRSYLNGQAGLVLYLVLWQRGVECAMAGVLDEYVSSFHGDE